MSGGGADDHTMNSGSGQGGVSSDDLSNTGRAPDTARNGDLNNSRKQGTTSYDDLSNSRKQGTTSYDDLSNSRKQGTTSYDDLSNSRKQGTTSYDDLSNGRKQGTTSYGDLSNSRKQGTSSCDIHASCDGQCTSKGKHLNCNDLENQPEACIEITESRLVPPDGGWGWMVVLGCFLGHFILEGLCRSMGIIYVALLERYRETATATALFNSLYNTIRMILGPMASMFADRYSCRVALIIGAVLSCVAFVLSAQASQLIHVHLAYGVLGGIAASFIFAPMYIIVGQYFDKKKGKAMSAGTLGCGVGSMVMAPLLTALLDEYALHGTFIISGALMLNCAVAGMLFRPLRSSTRVVVSTYRAVVPPGEHLANGTEKYKDVDGPQVTSGSSKAKNVGCLTSCFSRFSMLTDVTFLLYCSNVLAVCFCVQAPLTFLPALGLEKGFTLQQSAMLLSIAGFSDIVGRFVNGVIFDLKPFRHRRRPLFGLVGIITGCAVVAFGLMPSYVSLCVVIVVWGLAEAGFHGQRTTIISEIVREEQHSAAVGISIFFQGLGNMLAPITGALFRDAFKSYAICMYYFGSVVVISSGLFLLDYVWKQKCSRKTVGGQQ